KGTNIISSNDIETDPLFANITDHDYHLMSKAGRWLDYRWVIDSVNSPCIDAGYYLSDYSAEPEDNGNRINIGVFGNTKYASKSESATASTNHSPVINKIQDSTIKIGKLLTFKINGSDIDGDKLAYSASGLPKGATLSESGLFSWTPTARQQGTYAITFKVSDGKLENSTTVNIKVVKDERIFSSAKSMYDSRLCEASPENISKDTVFLDIGGMNKAGRYRDIIQFDLREYTNPSNISEATLSLNWYYPAGKSRPEDTIIDIYRPASSWNPSYVSWNKRGKNVAWNNPGGDWYDKYGISQGKTPYATITLKGNVLPDNKYYKFNVTTLVKEYASGKHKNTGFLIKARKEKNNYIAFRSIEAIKKDQRPMLTIEMKP
ncbi:MAG: disaggregatase related repeat-containing protein, partial [Methanosarcina sp.]